MLLHGSKKSSIIAGFPAFGNQGLTDCRWPQRPRAGGV